MVDKKLPLNLDLLLNAIGDGGIDMTFARLGERHESWSPKKHDLLFLKENQHVST